MLTTAQKYTLKKVGLVLEGPTVSVYSKEDAGEPIFQSDCSEIERIELKQSNDRNYSISKPVWYLLGRGISNPPYATIVYHLIFHLKNGEKKYSYLSNFDVIGTTSALKAFNNTLQNEL